MAQCHLVYGTFGLGGHLAYGDTWSGGKIMSALIKNVAHLLYSLDIVTVANRPASATSNLLNKLLVPGPE